MSKKVVSETLTTAGKQLEQGWHAPQGKGCVYQSEVDAVSPWGRVLKPDLAGASAGRGKLGQPFNCTGARLDNRGSTLPASTTASYPWPPGRVGFENPTPWGYGINFTSISASRTLGFKTRGS